MDIHFNNKINKVGDDLKANLKDDSEIRIVADIFSIYGYGAVKKELSKIGSFKFIFTNPAFIKDEEKNKQQRQFIINSALLEKSLAGSSFEINLKNELSGRSIARECKEWIDAKATFKASTSYRAIKPNLILENKNETIVYRGIDEFTSAGLGYENDVTLLSYPFRSSNKELIKDSLETFDSIWKDKDKLEDVTDEVIEYVASLYKENSPEYIYYFTLFNIFNEFLEDINEDEIANEKTGFKNSIIWNMLYDFQKDAVLGVINKLQRHNGCILADSVGLGKTFTALGVMKYFQERNKSILVLCPKKLSDNWKTFKSQYDDNPLVKDRFNYTVLYHTDLSRDKGFSGDTDLSRINWGTYDLVVIDESHNFRNNTARKDRETRYERLMKYVMKEGVKTKVLMLSATPVNNKFTDLKNQLALAYEGQTSSKDHKLDVEKSIDSVLSSAQKTFNAWSKLPPEERSGKKLINQLSNNYDFFKLLDGITIARSRQHVTNYYDTSKIGKFPNRLKPITVRSEITDDPNFISIEDIYKNLSKLNLSIYAPSNYILETKKDIYSKLYDTLTDQGSHFSQSSRETTLLKLQRVNLLKRLESSIDSFRITLSKFIDKNKNAIESIESFSEGQSSVKAEFDDFTEDDYDFENEEWLDEENSIGDKVKINLSDMNIERWQRDLQDDIDIAQQLLDYANKVSPDKDRKLQDLKLQIQNKLDNPINTNNQKVVIFSAFADTANYLYENISQWALQNHKLHTAKVTGSDNNKCTLEINKQFNNLLINFSPRSKNRSEKLSQDPEIDILIATDCISEGQNLQDCDFLVNYDIHWNPVRIIQRFGRIDRIGSTNTDIQLVNFWPELDLDDYIKLKNRVENKMMMVDMTATGEDNVLTNESSDLMFRKKQLEKLQEEVVDIEEMDTGVSITDLGLNDFRMDLVNFINDETTPDLSNAPTGVHTVAKSHDENEAPKGVIFVLKNINTSVNIENANQLHPFYLVYISDEGIVHLNHMNIKHTLDILRKISKGNPEPIKGLYEEFNTETDDGRKMQKYSQLLEESISSIVNVNTEKDIDSIFVDGGVNLGSLNIKGLEDFELISFIAVR